MNQVEIYTDGACKGNPGPGGWGALLRCNGHEKELYGGEPVTTNNRMELLAVISKYVSVSADNIKVQLERQDHMEVLEVNIVLPDQRG